MGNVRRRAWSLFFVSLLFLAGAAGALAQAATGTITGTVVDDGALVVPGATVTVTLASTGAVRSMPSNEVGLFRFAALPPGTYTVSVDLPGFSPVKVTGILLTSSEIRDVGKVVLRVGTQTEAVLVTANVTPVQVASSERSSTILGEQLQNIQLKGRDLYGFMSTLPGVVDTNRSRDFTTWTSMSNISINGAPSGSRNILLDGINILDEGANQNAFVNPNIDAVAEVRVETNGFQAEFGRNSGGTVNIITKSGSSKLHASGWYNARRTSWTENTYLNKLQNLPKPLYKINIDGYSVGGPVIIPNVVSSKRRLYFFASQEFTNDARPVGSVTANLPTDAERRGDFSDTRQTNGSVLPIVDSVTGAPFPGNVIPSNRINPMGQALLNLLPAPNGYVNPQSGQQYTANFVDNASPKHNRRDDVIRMDWTATDHTSMYVKFIQDQENTISSSLIAPGVGHLINFVPGWTVSGHISQVLSDSLVNEINTGYGHNNFGNRRDDSEDATQYYRSTVGIDPPRLKPFNAVSSSTPAIKGLQNDNWPYLPILTFSGGNRTNLPGFYPGTTNGGGRVLPQANLNNLFSISDDLSKTLGRHNLKTGVYVEHSIKTEPNLGSSYMGSFNFGSTTNNPLDTGYGYSNAMLGVFQTYTEASDRGNSQLEQWQVEGYLQDNWRMTKRWTLDYGVRIYHVGAFTESAHANAGFFPDLYSAALAPSIYRPTCLTGAAGNSACATANQRSVDPRTGTLASIALQGTVVPGSGLTANGMKADGISGKGDYYKYPMAEFAPRFGFAWDITGDSKTALRGSAGVFYNRPGKGGYGSFFGGPPVIDTSTIRFATLDTLQSLASVASVAPVSGVGIVDNGMRQLERAYQANLTFQRDIGFNTVVDIAYVANYIRNSSRSVNLNYVPYATYASPSSQFNNTELSSIYLATAYPGMGNLNYTFTDLASLDYNALQTQISHRLSKGLQFGMSYTLSRAYSTSAPDVYSLQGLTPYTPNQWYHNISSSDRTHVMNINYNYDIPTVSGPKLLRRVFSNWQVSGITAFVSGTPYSPSCSINTGGANVQDPTLTGLPFRCQLVSGQDPFATTPATGGDPTSALHWNPAAFAMPVSTGGIPAFGDAPQNMFRQPAWSNWDLTLARTFPFNKAKVRLQVQAYNVFNQVEFTTIGSALTFGSVGGAIANTSTTTAKYTTATGTPRQVGVTLRVEF